MWRWMISKQNLATVWKRGNDDDDNIEEDDDKKPSEMEVAPPP